MTSRVHMMQNILHFKDVFPRIVAAMCYLQISFSMARYASLPDSFALIDGKSLSNV